VGVTSEEERVRTKGEENVRSWSYVSRHPLWSAILAGLIVAGIIALLSSLGDSGNEGGEVSPTAIPMENSSAPPVTSSPSIEASQGSQPGTPSAPTRQEKLYLSTVEPVNSFSDVEAGPIRIDGTEYPQSLHFITSLSESYWADYDLGRDYKTLSGVLGVIDEAHMDEVCHWRILADGKEVFAAKTRLGKAVIIPPINVDGVLRLRIEVLDGGGENGLPYPCGVGDGAVE
jgi:NPCBM/NEW2 domain